MAQLQGLRVQHALSMPQYPVWRSGMNAEKMTAGKVDIIRGRSLGIMGGALIYNRYTIQRGLLTNLL